jgi:hypothetical protein
MYLSLIQLVSIGGFVLLLLANWLWSLWKTERQRREIERLRLLEKTLHDSGFELYEHADGRFGLRGQNTIYLPDNSMKVVKTLNQKDGEKWDP